MKWRQSQKGSAFLTTLITLPVVGAFLGGAMELGLLYQNRAVLNAAALSAARAGAHEGASPTAIKKGLANGLAPIFVRGSGYAEMQARVSSIARADIEQNACVRILNPNRGAFTDFDVTPADPKRDNKISLYELETLDLGVGAASGTTIQDAMLLQVYVLYGVETKIPIIGPMITQTMARFSGATGMKQSLLQNGRIPIEVQSVTRMQSNAKLSGIVEAKGSGRFSC